MNKRLINSQPSILILADFSDGSWHASSFAIQYLYKEGLQVTILQTFQNPDWGHLMMRKLSHHLKEITKNELKALKKRLLTHFADKKIEVNTLSIEGELNSVLNYKPIINGLHYLVLSTYSSFQDSCKRQNGCLERIINTAQNPLFILPETFEEGTSKKILFIGNSEQKPSVQLCSQVREICKKTQSKLEVLFVQRSQHQEIPQEIQSYYHKYFENIDIAFNTIQSKTKCRGINNYLNNSNRDLLVIAND